MNNIEHYLEVAEEEGASIILGVIDKTAGIVTFNINEFEAYTARILADKEAEIRQLTNDCNFLHEKNLRLNKQLSEAQALIAMQAEALKIALHQNQCDMLLTGEECRKLEAVISASTESVAAWEEAKLKPLRLRELELQKLLEIEANEKAKYKAMLKITSTENEKMLQQQVAMLYKYLNFAWVENIPDGVSIEDMALEAKEALRDTQATAEAHEREVEQRGAVKALEDAGWKMGEESRATLFEMAAEIRKYK